ncbi:haloacid dehalogenase type II [Burkholderia lata]|uniref:haloacid dehalogenase type II n=1 Tax=Burkholderia lata (strain ATCC 17760 / DSM 23089 / LMG 22485 / NCIMB 9086 / R18194 / 383) TaxID=482957 RepID=UPI00145452A6|nr:haloacid dehalogenase type II [Burkholderia lata]VWB87616.1 haloacid dehalogenase [Burkholderia lata]
MNSTPRPALDVKILAFDVFGTVVDWHQTVMREVSALGLAIDADQFTLAWRAGYIPAMQKVASGQLGWTRIDELHRVILDEILQSYGIEHLSETQKQRLNKVWHRLDPWPDSVAGLLRLKKRYMICTLSNGNIGLLANLSKHASLPWDCILSAEVFRKYKPDPATYLGVAQVFDVKPSEVLMVAAHQDDLAHAREAGLKTAYIERPLEYGQFKKKDVSRAPGNSLHAKDLVELANLLDC